MPQASDLVVSIRSSARRSSSDAFDSIRRSVGSANELSERRSPNTSPSESRSARSASLLRPTRARRGSTTLETIRALSTSLSRALSPGAQRHVLVWADEFDCEGLPDPRRWSYQTEANKWTGKPENGELQWYTAERAKNAHVSGGTLKIRAVKESFAGRGYTSARLSSRCKGDWLYGRIEVCAKLPSAARGIWPAIWMRPTDNSYGTWPESGELDLMENVGYEEGVLRSSIHTGRYNHRTKSHLMGTIARKDAHHKFHVYSLQWTPNKVSFFVDSMYAPHPAEGEVGVAVLR